MFAPFTCSTATSVFSNPVEVRTLAGAPFGSCVWAMSTGENTVTIGVIVKSQATPL